MILSPDCKHMILKNGEEYSVTELKENSEHKKPELGEPKFFEMNRFHLFDLHFISNSYFAAPTKP